MTTNRDIVFEQLLDTIIDCQAQKLMTMKEMKFLKEDIVSLCESLEEKEATKKQISWNMDNTI